MNLHFRDLVLLASLLLSTNSFSAAAPSLPENIVGTNWIFVGDSQTIGRAAQQNTKSHASAFKKIWESSFGIDIKQQINGESGRTLEQTRNYYLNKTINKEATWVHFQESGNQLSGGGSQNTPNKFITQFENMVRAIHKRSPHAIISTETAYSFEAESMRGRNWDQYNQTMETSVARLAAEDTHIHVAQVDKNIKALVTAKRKQLGHEAGQQAVWGDTDNRIKRHYTGLGNFMVALSIYDALEFDLNKLNFDSIPNNEISKKDKDLCVKLLQKK